MVRATGLEPARTAPLEPKSNVSANFTMPAFTRIVYLIIFRNASQNSRKLSIRNSIRLIIFRNDYLLFIDYYVK